MYIYNYIYGVEAAKRDLAHIIKFCYKNASRLNRYNLPTIIAIHFLFSTLHTTPFLYGKVDFGVLLVPVLQRPIPLGVQTRNIFLQENSIHFKFGLYVEGSCTYQSALFINFYSIRYGDTAVQVKFIFPA